MSTILKGVRILDFGRYIAGPYCAALLADLGADVIRVERIGGGEDRYIYPVAAGGDGALFLQMNRNKRAITLDPKSAGAGEILRRLVGSANVVVANLPQAALEELGLDYASLTAIRPDIILAAISAFGPSGPYAERVGFDAIGQAMSGAAHLSGFGRPTKTFASWVDMMSASLAAFGTLAAIHEHASSGQGQIVQASLFASALTVMNFPLIEQAVTGEDRAATGNRGQSGAPADFFETTDGWIAIQVIGEPLFKRWARLVRQTDWIGDPRFASDALRSDNGALLSERTAAWCAGLSSDEALAALAAARIPSGPVFSPRAVLADPHVRETGMFEAMDYPGLAKPAPVNLKAFDMSRTPVELGRRAPVLGEHTNEVLVELGFDFKEIEAFRASNTI